MSLFATATSTRPPRRRTTLTLRAYDGQRRPCSPSRRDAAGTARGAPVAVRAPGRRRRRSPASTSTATRSGSRRSTTSASPRRRSRTRTSRAARRAPCRPATPRSRSPATSPASTFTCSLDGGPAEACASPSRIRGLGRRPAHVHGRRARPLGHDGREPAARGRGPSPPVAAARPRRRRRARRRRQLPRRRQRRARPTPTRTGSATPASSSPPARRRSWPAGRDTGAPALGRRVREAARRRGAERVHRRALRVPFQDSGFLPLKGVAAVPVGSTVDTRRGAVALHRGDQRPARAQPPAAPPRGPLPRGHLRDPPGARSAQAPSAKRIPPRAELVSAAGRRGAVRARASRRRPRASACARWSMTAKGVFRAVGGAATADARQGHRDLHHHRPLRRHVTEVGRGRVAVIGKRTRQAPRRPARAGLPRASAAVRRPQGRAADLREAALRCAGERQLRLGRGAAWASGARRAGWARTRTRTRRRGPLAAQRRLATRSGPPAARVPMLPCPAVSRAIASGARRRGHAGRRARRGPWR